MNAKKVFEREWALYREGAKGFGRPDGEGKRRDGNFDGDVKCGEYRIFADMSRPLVALVVEERGMAGWRVIPVSPLTVPASSREMVVGERVLQLWNSCVVSRHLAERSWRVDEVSGADMKDVVERLKGVVPGRIAAGEGPVAEYEKAFLLPGGSLEPLLSEKPGVMKPLAWRRYGAWSIAAMLMVCLGATWLVYQEQLKSNEASRLDNIRRVMKADAELRGAELVDLCEEAEDNVSGGEIAPDRLVDIKVDAAVPAAAKPVICAAPPPQAEEDRFVIRSALRISSPVTTRACYGKASRESLRRDGSFGTEGYAEFRENEFLDPKSEPLSTFSLDVDTSSYAMMRRYLTDEKRLPPPNSVRLEEYVNYFRYKYAEPKGDSPIAVDCELAECPWNKAHKLLRLGVQAKRLEGDSLPPCNLTFLVDRSGSMACNNGMELLKGGLRLLVSKLRAEDHVSIVTYADGTNVLLGSTPGSEKGKILAAIDSLRAGGCTYGSAGIQLAYEEAARNFDKKANNRVILVTDGDFNVGISSPKELEDFIAARRSSGIFLSVIGVGAGNYQDGKMKKLANAGNGNYAYLDSMLEAKKVMMSEFGGTLFTVAKDVKVQIEFNPSQVASYRLLGYENRLLKAKDFNDDKKDAGEIGSGHTMTAFYELVPAGAVADAGTSVDPLKYQKSTTVESAELFTLKTRWKAPDGDASKLNEIAWRASDITKGEPSEDFRFASAVAEFALILEESKFKGDASLEDVLRRARGAKGSDEEGYRAEFIRLVEAVELITGRFNLVPVDVDI